MAVFYIVFDLTLRIIWLSVFLFVLAVFYIVSDLILKTIWLSIFISIFIDEI